MIANSAYSSSHDSYPNRETHFLEGGSHAIRCGIGLTAGASHVRSK